MSTFRGGALGVGLGLVAFLVSGNPAEGQVRIQKAQIQKAVQQIQIQPFRGAAGPLVPAEVKDKLDLTAEQKEKVAKLEKEFEEKSKENQDKLRDLRQNLANNRNAETIQKVRELTQAGQKVREEYEGKVTAVLNDEQKKKFEEARRQVRRPGVLQPGQVRPFQRPADNQGQLLPKDVQEKLNLSAEQREKLEKIQKEFESKTLEVLTDEQKKQYEELKKQPVRPNLRPIQPRPNR